MKSIRLTILGDICPTGDTRIAIESGDAKSVLGEITQILSTADLSLCNVEFPMINSGRPSVKTGPILGGKTSSINFFKNAGFDLLSLANNHIKDYGDEGVRSTLRAASEVNIPTIGAGLTLSEAKKGYVKELNGIRIGVLAFAEQEFNTATESSPGASFIDPYVDFEEIAKFKASLDYLIILYHGGIEYYEYPSPVLQKKCRKMVESGADFVTCQHSHIIGTRESYQSGEILYGQGNSVFGYREGKNSWNNGLLVSLDLVKSGSGHVKGDINYIPISAHASGGIEVLPQVEKDKILSDFQTRSTKLNDPSFLKKEWVEFCTKQVDLVLPQLLGYNRWLIHLNRLTKGLLNKLFFSKMKAMVTHNLIRCEAHNEVVQTLLGEKYK